MEIASFSGGQTSAYMTIKLKELYPDLLVIFANTGQEHSKTLEFVDKIDKLYNLNVVWLEADVCFEKNKGTKHKIVNYKTACRNHRLFEDMVKKYGITNQAYPHCTRELKLMPIRSFLRSEKITGYRMNIGIRFDEKRRCSKNAEKEKLVYPLVDWKIDKVDIEDFFEDHQVKLGLEQRQGNCVWCWKKSFSKHFANLGSEEKDFYKVPDYLEEHYGLSGSNRDGKKRVFFRGHKSTKDLIAMYEAIGKKSELSKQLSFDDLGCSESCEPF